MKLLSEEESLKARDVELQPIITYFIRSEESLLKAQAHLTHQEIVAWLKERNHGFEGRLFIIKIDWDEWDAFQQGDYK